MIKTHYSILVFALIVTACGGGGAGNSLNGGAYRPGDLPSSNHPTYPGGGSGSGSDNLNPGLGDGNNNGDNNITPPPVFLPTNQIVNLDLLDNRNQLRHMITATSLMPGISFIDDPAYGFAVSVSHRANLFPPTTTFRDFSAGNGYVISSINRTYTVEGSGTSATHRWQDHLVLGGVAQELEHLDFGYWYSRAITDVSYRGDSWSIGGGNSGTSFVIGLESAPAAINGLPVGTSFSGAALAVAVYSRVGEDGKILESASERIAGNVELTLLGTAAGDRWNSSLTIHFPDFYTLTSTNCISGNFCILNIQDEPNNVGKWRLAGHNTVSGSTQYQFYGPTASEVGGILNLFGLTQGNDFAMTQLQINGAFGASTGLSPALLNLIR